jgi:glycosyltransferase involved in cell wall biosynthesis
MLLENFTYPQDTRVRNEAECLACAGHAITVLAPRGEGQPASERIAGVEVRRYRTAWAGHSARSYLKEYAIAHARLLGGSLRALLGGARILHFHGPPDTLALIGLLARAAGGRVVYDMHDSAPELFAAKFGSSPALRPLRAAQDAAIRWADQVIVTNETQRELLCSRRAALGKSVTIVRNGPRITEFGEPFAPRAGNLTAPELVYVGTLDIQDGVLELADVMCTAAMQGARLTIVGDGAAREQLAARCQQLGVGDRVTFTGRVAHERVAALTAQADICIDPAPGTELNHGSTMIKIAEYMACGRPTVAYDLRETRRTAGDCALYAPCGDIVAFAEQIQALAQDSEHRLGLGEMARARASKLTWDHSGQALLGVYAALAAMR